jgi:hypothetical protein
MKMKKMLWSALALFVFSGTVAIAALPNHYIDTLPAQQSAGSFPVANGYDWGISTSTNSVAPALPSYTLAQLNALTAQTTGQIVYCNNCTNSIICVSSGTVGAGSFVGVSSWTIVGCK